MPPWVGGGRLFQRTSKPPVAASSRGPAGKGDRVPVAEPVSPRALAAPHFDLSKVVRPPSGRTLQRVESHQPEGPEGSAEGSGPVRKIPLAAFLTPSGGRRNRTDLPDRLKSGLEALSGISRDDVRVHRYSKEPEGVQAHAFARGSEIHLGPGQERHLPHEAWHVVQQKQGRVRANGAVGGSPLNDSAHLEREATVMGGRAGGVEGSMADGSRAASLDFKGAYFAPQSLPTVQAPMQRVFTDSDGNHMRDADVIKNIEDAKVAPGQKATLHRRHGHSREYVLENSLAKAKNGELEEFQGDDEKYSSARTASGFVNKPHFHSTNIDLYYGAAQSPVPIDRDKKDWIQSPSRSLEAFTPTHTQPSKIVRGHRNTVMGHAPGKDAVLKWNHGGHTKHRSENERDNSDIQNYHGLEEYHDSAASGGATQHRYLIPGPEKGSHEMYFNTEHLDYRKNNPASWPRLVNRNGKWENDPNWYASTNVTGSSVPVTTADASPAQNFVPSATPILVGSGPISPQTITPSQGSAHSTPNLSGSHLPASLTNSDTAHDAAPQYPTINQYGSMLSNVAPAGQSNQDQPTFYDDPSSPRFDSMNTQWKTFHQSISQHEVDDKKPTSLSSSPLRSNSDPSLQVDVQNSSLKQQRPDRNDRPSFDGSLATISLPSILNHSPPTKEDSVTHPEDRQLTHDLLGHLASNHSPQMPDFQGGSTRGEQSQSSEGSAALSRRLSTSTLLQPPGLSTTINPQQSHPGDARLPTNGGSLLPSSIQAHGNPLHPYPDQPTKETAGNDEERHHKKQKTE